MKFSKVIGKCDPKIVKEAENKLSSVFTDLSLGYDNKAVGSNLGGDPFVFNLIYPLPHICDAMGEQLKEFEEIQKEIEKKIAEGKKVSKEERDQVDGDVKKYQKHMKGKVLSTAATDGRRFYWSPTFVIKQSKLGLRIVSMHEALHAHLMHPARRGSRLPRLYNVAVDFKVNHVILMDLKSRGRKDYVKDFKDALGDFITLEELAQMYRDPYNPPERLAHFNPIHNLREKIDPAYKHPGDDAPPTYYAEENLKGDMLRPENIYSYLYNCIPKCPKCGKLGAYKKPEEYKKLKKQIEEQEKKKAEEKSKTEAKKNESASSSDSKKDNNNQSSQQGNKSASKSKGAKNSQKDSKKNDKHDHSDDGDCCEHESQCNDNKNASGDQQGKDQENGQKSNGRQSGASNGQEFDSGDCCGDGKGQSQGQGESCNSGSDGSCNDGGGCGENGQCDECGGCGDDPFEIGDLLDEHMDTDVSEDELAKRLYDAAEMAKRMGGKTPLGMQDEIADLIAPKITWQDIVRQMITKKREGVGRADWQKPKSRPLFTGLYVPKKKDHFLNILVAYDCSGSMSAEDISFGISQLQVIDQKSEMYCVAFDFVPYWDQMVKIKKADKENLSKLKSIGRGGTAVNLVFNEYEKYCGKADLIIVISDNYLSDTELNDVKRPDRSTDTLWLCTSENKWKPPFGRTYNLRNE